MKTYKTFVSEAKMQINPGLFKLKRVGQWVDKSHDEYEADITFTSYDIMKNGKSVGELTTDDYFGHVYGTLMGKSLPDISEYGRGMKGDDTPYKNLYAFLNSKTGQKWATTGKLRNVNIFESTILVEQVTAQQLKEVEKFADKLFAKLDIDVAFTKHFIERVNDARNGKDITAAELVKLFRETYKKHGKKIAQMPDDAQAVIKQMENDLNMPFVFKWDSRNQEFDLVAKTIMRKKDFKTPNKVLSV